MIESLNEERKFDKIDFSNQRLQEIECIACSFSNCSFNNCDLTSCILIDSTFDSCNFSLTTFKNTTLKEITFINCKLVGIDFAVSNKFNFSMNFKDTIIDYCSFWGKKLKKTKFIKCSIKESDFSEADLSESTFDNCDLSMTVFRNTILKKSDFRTAHNFIIDPELNDLKNAKFSLLGTMGLLSKYELEIEI